jgi:sec-independent protein translocase protein TatC
MTSNYYKYYTEIKNRTLLVLFAWLFCLNICYYYKETILFILVNSNNSLLELDNKPYFIFTNVTEVFYVYFELILFIANQIALIMLIYQVLMFLALGLYQFEFLKLKFAFQVFTLTWLFSFLLLLNVIVPFSWNFFLSFQENISNPQSINLFFEAKLSEYLQYFIGLYYVCLINCQFLTILVITLTNLSEKLKKTKIFRKLFYLVFVVFSTIVTPPDVLSQIWISSFLILLYEFLILLREIKFNMATN